MVTGDYRLDAERLVERFVISQQPLSGNYDQGTGSAQALATARFWLDECLRDHDMCNEIYKHGRPLPSRVINVGDDEVGPFVCAGSGIDAPYLALSYCWGSSQHVTTTRATLADHMKALPMDSLPATLRDAILVTRKLGFQYIWIDALCIIQDDDQDWQNEAKNMMNVYANAILTLSAAASEESNGGLFFERQNGAITPMRLPKLPHSILRYMEEMNSDMPRYCSLSHHFENWHKISRSPVNSRAWTLQEQLLSTRILHFGSGLLVWECLSKAFHETNPHKNLAENVREKGQRQYYDTHEQRLTLLGGWSYLRSLAGQSDEELRNTIYFTWEQMVSKYSSRSLTRPSDKIPAFLGVCTRVAELLKDEFVGGVWKDTYFLRSILWSVDHPDHATKNESYPSWYVLLWGVIVVIDRIPLFKSVAKLY